MNFLKIIGELQKWAPVLELLKGMFGDADAALENVRAWELARRKETDARLRRLRDRDEGT